MFGNEKKPKRFKILHEESTNMKLFTVFQDTETGVNYIYSGAGYGGGLTVLLDKEGKPVVTLVKSDD